ncbi:1-propanol dehydrogenase PduQ [Listeria monocytogenes]|nr:iron-containing alcohol dehydrogenase [Listeria monocytogenes]EAC6130482.1 iron-containing alcohol dehydrogenase [Listeria monocytogenes]EAD3932688.1 iron-containing alcohol dehydrogenase [Listeria monocytogenes]EAE0442315.1 iron-containing alcohol dehydrogenase [Listeria monocytogenes]
MQKVSFKTDLYIGQGATDRLLDFKDKQIFIVTDPFMVSSGMINAITEKIDSSNTYTIFSEIIPDPPIENVVAGIEVLNECDANLMIAIGGGSAIDAAKAMKFFGQKLGTVRAMPFIVIPTTSGTGSEVTSFSVITNKEKAIKYPLITDAILPDEAILDADLVKSVPPAITADTGMDVLTHALEAYVSTKANDYSDAMAEKVIQLVFTYLERAYKDGNDLEAREKMHNASCLAGMAFNITSLGLNHGIAHTAGAKFKIPHGRMNTLLLPHVISYNAGITSDFGNNPDNRAAERYTAIAKLLKMPASNTRLGVRSLINAIKQLQKKLNMPTTLKECGISRTDLNENIAQIAEGALNDGCTATNPRIPTETDVSAILEKMLA